MVHEILEREIRKNYIAGKREVKLEIAKRLIRENIDIDIIVRMTNLSKKNYANGKLKSYVNSCFF